MQRLLSTLGISWCELGHFVGFLRCGLRIQLLGVSLSLVFLLFSLYSFVAVKSSLFLLYLVAFA